VKTVCLDTRSVAVSAVAGLAVGCVGKRESRLPSGDHRGSVASDRTRVFPLMLDPFSEVVSLFLCLQAAEVEEIPKRLPFVRANSTNTVSYANALRKRLMGDLELKGAETPPRDKGTASLGATPIGGKLTVDASALSTPQQHPPPFVRPPHAMTLTGFVIDSRSVRCVLLGVCLPHSVIHGESVGVAVP
jgi:hypothetical protein